MWYSGAVSQRIGTECTRCYGTGQVYDEVFEYEWTECPYFDIDANVVCEGGIIKPLRATGAGDQDVPESRQE